MDMHIEIKKVDVNSYKGIIDMNAFGHELCMGIRHGLYGSHASTDVNIDYPLMHGAEGLHEIANAINNLADAIRENR